MNLRFFSVIFLCMVLFSATVFSAETTTLVHKGADASPKPKKIILPPRVIEYPIDIKTPSEPIEIDADLEIKQSETQPIAIRISPTSGTAKITYTTPIAVTSLTTEVTLGNNELEFFDLLNEKHSIPFVIRLDIADNSWGSFFFESETYYYKINKSADKVIINLRSPEEPGLYNEKYEDEVVSDETIVLQGINGMPVHYKVFVNETFNHLWLLLKAQTFLTQYNKKIYFKGTDTLEQGNGEITQTIELQETPSTSGGGSGGGASIGINYYLPDDLEFATNYGGDPTDNDFFVGVFELIERPAFTLTTRPPVKVKRIELAENTSSQGGASGGAHGARKTVRIIRSNPIYAFIDTTFNENSLIVFPNPNLSNYKCEVQQKFSNGETLCLREDKGFNSSGFSENGSRLILANYVLTAKIPKLLKRAERIGEEETPSTVVISGALPVKAPVEAMVKERIRETMKTKTVKISRIQRARPVIEIQEGEVKAITNASVEVKDESISIESEATKGVPAVKVQVKVLPATASDKAREALQINPNKEIDLRIENKKPVYRVRARRKARLLAILPVEYDMEAVVNAETGAIESTNKGPWWAFLTIPETKD